MELLPALPRVWKSGSVHGLRARGGLVVDLAWAEGRLAEARLQSELRGPCRVRYGDRTAKFELAKGAKIALDGELRVTKGAE